MIASILAFALTSAAAMPQAQPTQVFRCRGRHGEAVFSGVPCADRSNFQANPGYGDNFDSQDGWGSPCPDTAQRLSDRVAAAFDSGNVNALGGLFLWQGFATRTAYKYLNELRRMLKQPLAGLTLVATPASTWLDNAPSGPDSAESLQVEVAVPGMGDTSQIWRFPVIERDACFWLEYAPMQKPLFP